MAIFGCYTGHLCLVYFSHSQCVVHYVQVGTVLLDYINISLNGYIWLFIVSRCLVYLYLVVRLVGVSIFQLSSRGLVYLYLVLSLVAVSICPVIKQMPCLSVFGC